MAAAEVGWTAELETLEGLQGGGEHGGAWGWEGSEDGQT